MGAHRTVTLAVLVLLAAAVRSTFSTEFVEYYGLLGVSRDVSPADLKKTFRKRSIDLHPDKNRAPDAVAQFQALREAYECLSDPASRQYYDTYEETWAEMKEYEEKHLKSFQRQMFQQGGRVYMKNVEVELEEMFLGEAHVQMLHQSFAAKLLGNFPGVWVLFFGNPHCGPCRQMAPKIKHFAREVASSRDWLRVGTVNMGVNANGNLLDHFGAATNTIPQVILVAPTGGTGLGLQSRLADFEIFDRGRDGGWAFARRLLAACEQLRDSAVPELRAVSGGGVASAVAEGQRIAAADGGPDANPRAKWAVLVVDDSNAAAGLVPVFRRLAQKTRHAGFVFRVLQCTDDPDADAHAASVHACEEAESFPELRLYGSRHAAAGGEPELLLATDPSELLSGGAVDAERYGYDEEQTGFAIFVEAMFRTSSPGEERFPKSVTVTGSPRSTFVNGEFTLIGTSNGRPLYKKKNNNVYLRWLSPSQRGQTKGAWLLSDTPEPLDQGWAFMELDQLVPVGGDGWKLLSEGGNGFRLETGMTAVNSEDWAVRESGREDSSTASTKSEL